MADGQGDGGSPSHSMRRIRNDIERSAPTNDSQPADSGETPD